MRQSNTYIIVFTSILTVILGGLLSFTAVYLKPIQEKEVELETKKQILSAVIDVSMLEKSKIAEIYKQRIQSFVVDAKGNELSSNEYGAGKPEDIDISKQYKLSKKSPQEMKLPVFKCMKKGSTTQIEAYIVPVYGYGLWDNIWGFVAIKGDLNTLAGVTFDHRGETPGLGARITEKEVQNRYVGKKLYDNNWVLKSVNMLKGESNNNLSEHQIDGMSGATITGNGVNDMLKNYIGYYEPYFKRLKTNS